MTIQGVAFILYAGCKTQGLVYLRPKNPTRNWPFHHHLLVQMKSHSRYLWGLQEPGFCSGKGMGGKHSVHSFLVHYAHKSVLSYY
jgi:hypothetical protein